MSLVQNISKAYPCWRIYKQGEKLPFMSFHNGRRIDLSQSDIVSMLENMSLGDLLLFQDHLYYGVYQPCHGETAYEFGCNFSVSKNEDGSYCVFGNGCLFE